jgi:dTDP-4-dehydrorhamnose 3,5-epimerase
MQIREFAIKALVEITPKKFGDARGYFMESFSRDRLIDAGLPGEWVQDNQSYSAEKYVLRGLHLQIAPFAQAKLVRVLKGSIFDVAVDLRKNSPSYGQWDYCILTAEKANQLYVPVGFAHGFLTLEHHTEVFYKVTAAYAPNYEVGIRYDDPVLAVQWPLDGATPVLSDKDMKAPRLADVESTILF